jgi:aminopeptidase N
LDGLGATLADGTLEPAFVALALTLPGEADIAREIGHEVDPDAVFAARTELRARIGEHLAGPLFDHYRRLSESRPYRPDAADAGRRALRNGSRCRRLSRNRLRSSASRR